MSYARRASSLFSMKLSLIVISLCTGALASFAAAPMRPNVLFIVVDDLRTELGCYGAPVQTPALDRLARAGLLFERAYCQQAVCNPSRASVLAGVRPDTTQVLDNSRVVRAALPDVVTLPQHFKNHGYHTVSVGKVFHHEEVETGGDVRNRPGDDPLSWSEEPWFHGQPYAQWFRPESHALVAAMRALPKEKQPRVMRGPPYEAADVSDDAPPDGQIALQAIATLRRLKGKPFFLAVGFRRPHLPLNAPQKYWDLYPPESIHLPSSARPPLGVPAVALHNSYELRSYAGAPKSGPIPKSEALALIRAYRAAVSYVDAQVGRVVDELAALDLFENTIIVVWGDHGYHLGEQDLWGKMSNFEIATRVPLIIHAPHQITAGRRSKQIVELVDLYPTLAELSGLPLPAHLEGTSFALLLAAPDRPWKTAAFSQYPRSAGGRYNPATDPMGRSVRTARHRYTEWTGPGGERVGTELYDLSSTAGEQQNIANESAQRDLVARLSSQLAAGWRGALPKL